MPKSFQPKCHCLLIGSFPVTDHQKAGELVLTYSPDIPVWPQLPVYPIEGMIPQFLSGMPGVVEANGKTFIDTKSDTFETELVAFYEQYLGVSDGSVDIAASDFALTPETAKGFFVLLETLQKSDTLPLAVKGQITGPFTFATGVVDQDKKAVFYNEQLRDAAVKLLSMKAKWQLDQLARFDVPKIIFIDEPALTGFGSSEFTSISREDVTTCLEEVISAIHEAGGVAGIHVCGNTDWSLILASNVDIVNFDTYAYFDRFVLYGNEIKTFLQRGGLLAWGIVPTLLAEDIDKESVASLVEKLKSQMDEIEKLGVAKATILAQSIITPSCGVGPLDETHAVRVLQLNQSISKEIRKTL